MTIIAVDHYATPSRPGLRLAAVSPISILRAAGEAAVSMWRRHRTERALMALTAWQRMDCGIERPDIRSACELEAAARRRLASGMPTDWC